MEWTLVCHHGNGLLSLANQRQSPDMLSATVFSGTVYFIILDCSICKFRSHDTWIKAQKGLNISPDGLTGVYHREIPDLIL